MWDWAVFAKFWVKGRIHWIIFLNFLNGNRVAKFNTYEIYGVFELSLYELSGKY